MRIDIQKVNSASPVTAKSLRTHSTGAAAVGAANPTRRRQSSSGTRYSQ
jgi:hypothetical protein